MAPASSSNPSSSKGVLTWRPTKIMNMHDLSKDDDYLSHLLVEKLGTGAVPLLVHKMDSSCRLPKTPASDLLKIVRRLVQTKGPITQLVNRAVDDLLRLAPVRYYLQSYTQKQINAFATHASRYFELYNPGGSIEIAHTSRYSHRTGKSELCILATRNLVPGTVITELKGSMANLTDEEDRELKRTDLRHSDIRRDFSVIHSKSMKKNHLFLGPARFVNHDCENNCELFREGRYITFRVIKPIALGEEITAHYGDGYFGRKNRNCLCETCEKKGRGGYAPVQNDDVSDSSDSDSDSDVYSSDVSSEEEKDKNVNLDERRTRRGVYAVVTKEDESDESEDEEEDVVPLAGATDIPSAVEIELTTEADTISELTSLVSSRAPSNTEHPGPSHSQTPDPSGSASAARSTSSLSSLSSTEDKSSASTSSTPFRSIISTRRQKAQEEARTAAESPTPSRTTSVSPSKRITRSSSLISLNAKGKGKGNERNSMSATPRRDIKSKEDAVKVKREDTTDPKILRARSGASNTPTEPPPKPEPPKGPDGKPLPLCCTCSSVLPLISVDHKIVWGEGMESLSIKKRAKQECPRCMRHMAIYGIPWPRRTPLPGTTSNFVPTPKESTPVESSRRVTQKVLPDLDRKLAAAAGSKKRKRDDEVGDAEVEKPTKKKAKTDSSETSGNGKGQTAEEESTPKRKRGRPRLASSPSKKPETVVKTEENDQTILHPKGFKCQSRHMDGRFGVSTALPSDSSPHSRAQRALEREKQKERLEQEARSRKRPGDDEDDEDDVLETKRARCEIPLRRLFPKPSGLRGGNLFGRPNPLSFAARAWSGPLIPDDGSSEDERGPHTPENSASPPVITIQSGEEPPVMITATVAPSLNFKPTPFSFARRRWSSLCTSPTEEDHSDSNLSCSSQSAEEGEPPSTKSLSSGSWVLQHDMYSSEEEVRGPPSRSYKHLFIE
ncbi:histone lysine methyltransferase Set9, variant 2 [Stygiomarasmius scandens]|uniref:Histone lysine methyltransferase Set9, variant 2 n=1 Tax=Marasmiellus scandens TaxID=2682957 RepID=A0ABR1K7T7_9AGAR